MNKHEKEASEKVMQLLTAAWINQSMYVVTRLGIPDILSDGPISVNELSRVTKSHTPFLYRTMRALASAGFFYEEADRVFSVAPMGEMLQKDKMQPIVLMFLSEWHNHAWGKLLHSVQTGNIAFDSAFGKPCFEWFKEHPQEADIFNRANHIKAIASHTAVTKVYDFSGFNSIVDVGGGYGGLLYHILINNPNIKGIIADLPYMENEVKKQISANNLKGRCEFTDCNFFEKIPDSSDCYILSNILHDWDDGKCGIILRNCYNAMTSNARLLIIESIIPGTKEFSISKLLDLEVLVMGGGKERTEMEYRELLNKSGLNLKQIVNTGESSAVLECAK
jgi:hypothetical protein